MNQIPVTDDMMQALAESGEILHEQSDRGAIVQTKFPTDVASHTGTMNAEQVSADIRSRV